MTTIVPPLAGADTPQTDLTRDFYNSILPPTGLRVLATFKNGLKNPPTHNFYETNAELISAARQIGNSKNVYHGCATYKQPTNRKGSNVDKVKALWIDADVGPKKPYATAEDATTAIERARVTLDLEPPWLVKSGGGIHAYFSFSKPIPHEAWTYIAGKFRECLDSLGVKHDSSRTQDIASILRIPGTLNLKLPEARPVSVLQQGVEESPTRILEKLDAYQATTGTATSPARSPATSAATNDLVGVKDYPPTQGDKVAAHCPVIKEVADSGGDVDYDIWWRTMGVAKHTTDPEVVAAHWTRNRAVTNHDKSDWQSAINNWEAGPTTCAEFSKHSDRCATCPNSRTVKSPIQLGAITGQEVQALPQSQQATIAAATPSYVTEFNQRFAMVRVGSDYSILDTQTPHQTLTGIRYGTGFLKPTAFIQMHAGRTVEIDGKKVNVASAYLRHPLRWQYDGITFAPGMALSAGRAAIYNLWRGFGVNAVSGNVEPWLDLLTALVPDPTLRDWVLCWLAWKVQNPGGVPGTVLILTGGKGAGKNSLFEPIVQLFGAHGAIYDDGEQVAGRFNLHTLDKAFIVLDEALFIGDAQKNERIKSRITATQLGYEGKGVGVIQDQNHAAYVLLTNHKDVWQATPDERRPAVVEVGSELKNNTAFFTTYHQWLAAGGASALLAYLQQVDVSAFNVRLIPQTAALHRQIASTSLRDPAMAWWFGCLDEGAIAVAQGVSIPLLDAAPTTIPTRTLQDSFESEIRTCRGYVGGWSEVAKKLYSWTGGPRQHRPTRNGSRARVVDLPDLNTMRALFTKATGVEFE